MLNYQRVPQKGHILDLYFGWNMVKSSDKSIEMSIFLAGEQHVFLCFSMVKCPIFWGSFVSPRVQQLAASAAAFAARTTEGHVVTWGHPDYGGDGAAETSGECR